MILFVVGDLKLYATGIGIEKGEFWATLMQYATISIPLHRHGSKLFSEGKLTTTYLITGTGI